MEGPGKDITKAGFPQRPTESVSLKGVGSLPVSLKPSWMPQGKPSKGAGMLYARYERARRVEISSLSRIIGIVGLYVVFQMSRKRIES